MAAITSTNQTNPLANSIVQKFDSNRDGSLSSDEFAAFLTQLVGSLSTPQNVTATKTGVPAPTPGAERTGVRGALLFGGAPVPTVAASGAAKGSTSPRGVPTHTASPVRVGYMAGFDDIKLADLSHNSFKYQIGRILQYHPNTPQGLRDALPEIQALVPGATIIGTNGDKVDFGNYENPRSGRIGVIDVLVGAGEGGRAWAWQPVE